MHCSSIKVLQGRRHSLFAAPRDECRLAPLLLAAVGDPYMRALQAVGLALSLARVFHGQINLCRLRILSSLCSTNLCYACVKLLVLSHLPSTGKYYLLMSLVVFHCVGD